MKTAADILASVQDLKELLAGHAAALERAESASAEAQAALQRAQEAADELREWGAALQLAAEAAKLMFVIESN